MASLHLQHIKDNRLESPTADEYLALLTDYEWDHRQNRKIDRLLTQANFKQKANLADVNYAQSRNLDKNMLGYKTIYCNTARLFYKLKLSKMDGTYLKELKNS